MNGTSLRAPAGGTPTGLVSCPAKRRCMQDVWSAVDAFVDDHLIGDDPALKEALAGNKAAGLPAIDVSPALGKFLHLLARIAGARRILEIGTLGGYSSIWLSRALPAGGRLVSLELDEAHAAVARANVARAGLSTLVDVRVGPALDSLPKLAAEGGEPFDLVFIDADKENNPHYFAWAHRLARPGSVIVVDNVVRHGAIIDAQKTDPAVEGTRELFRRLRDRTDVTATAIATVGAKGFDGFILALVNEPPAKVCAVFARFLAALLTALYVAGTALAAATARCATSCRPETAGWASILAGIAANTGVVIQPDAKNSEQALAQLMSDGKSPAADVWCITRRRPAFK